MVAWVDEKPRWPGWMQAAVEALPRSRMLTERYCEGRVLVLLPRENGEARRSRPKKRAQEENPKEAEASAARRPYIWALDALKDQEQRWSLTFGRMRTVSRAGVVQCQQGDTKEEVRLPPPPSDYGRYACENSGYCQASPAEEASDGGPSVGVAEAGRGLAT